jgi:hypothetical protein
MEIDESLVTMITQELLKRLGKGETLAGGTEKNEKPPLFLVGGASVLSPPVLASLESRFGIIAHDSLDADFPEDASVLVTKMSIQALTRVSEGDEGCTPEGHALLWAVLRGKTAVILEEGMVWRAFGGTMPRPLLEKYCAHERALASYGIKIVKDADIAAVFSGGACPPRTVTIPAGPEIKPAGKRVISERELTLVCPESKGYGQTFAIGPRDILTPLAVEYVTRMRIVVSRSS